MSKRYCTPYKTITFNQNPWHDGMTYHECKSYECNYINDQIEVKLGLGMLYFTPEEFKKHFRVLGTK